MSSDLVMEMIKTEGTQPTLHEAATRGELMSQVAVARQYPRSVADFLSTAESLATLDEDTAASMWYSLPARQRGDKPIEGPGIRLAEVCFYSWRNLRAEILPESIDDKRVTVAATIFDTERNNIFRHRATKQIVTKAGVRYGEEMITRTIGAAGSIAFREAMFKAIPRLFVAKLLEKARATAVGTTETLVSRRSKMLSWFKQAGVPEGAVIARLDKKSVEEIGLEELGLLRGFASAIKDGEASIDDIFSDTIEQQSAHAISAKLRERAAARAAGEASSSQIRPGEQPAVTPAIEAAQKRLEAKRGKPKEPKEPEEQTSILPEMPSNLDNDAGELGDA